MKKLKQYNNRPISETVFEKLIGNNNTYFLGYQKEECSSCSLEGSSPLELHTKEHEGFYLFCPKCDFVSGEISFAEIDKLNPMVLSILKHSELTEPEKKAINGWKQKNTDYPYQDNERYARRGKLLQEISYQYLKRKGCCGFEDVELKVGENTLLFGFNFGH